MRAVDWHQCGYRYVCRTRLPIYGLLYGDLRVRLVAHLRRSLR